uniref:Uncharacterized protein n=1 Tax=Rangifer tarandus platyrhynchus TaxID=3082113 RepID=A0ACB0FE95_RANTA|nr:unnamed protein product [Rangifer tarandus platyrhynchus]
MFLSARSPQPRHPAPTPPGSHSPEPTPGASRQAPAANPGEGTPLSGSPPPPPRPANSSHPASTGGSAALGSPGQIAKQAPPRRSRFLPARPFQSPLGSSAQFPSAPSRARLPPRPLPRPPIFPLLRPVCLRRLVSSCAPALPAATHPIYLQCPGFLQSRARISFSGEVTSVFSKHQSALDSLFAGGGGVGLQDCFLYWAA